MRNTSRFIKTLLTLALAAIFLPAAATYIVHSLTGNVKISSSGKVSAAAKGDKLKASDLLSIPQGGSIEIRDDSDNKIYSSLKPGNLSVSMLISQSKAKAADNSANINSRLKFAERGKKATPGSRVYREKGMVTRSLNLFDSIASDIEIDPDALAQLIANTVYFGNVNGDSILNFSTLHLDAEPPAPTKPEIGFKLNNPLSTPVYFNVLRFSGVKERNADISPLGQPGGTYVLPAGQTMWRTQTGNFPYGEKHLLIGCHYSFDIDALIESLKKIINDDTLIINDPDPTLPVFIRMI